MTHAPSAPHRLHATALALDGRGLLLRGPSGSGKSALGLHMLALGAVLVADDAVALHRQGAEIHAARPASLPPWIEARGVGLLAPPVSDAPVPLRLVVDMGQLEAARLPPIRHTDILGVQLPLLHKVEAGYFPAALRAYLLHGIAPIDPQVNPQAPA